MRKSARFGAALLGVVLSVPACSGGEESGGGQDKVTLSYAVWDNNQKPVMEELAAEFTKDHPNITINVQLTPWADYWTKLQGGGHRRRGARRLLDERPQLPALRLQRRDHAAGRRDRPGQARPAVYPKPLVDLYTFERQAVRPAEGHGHGRRLVQQELFDADGRELPADDWTWADFKAAAAKLTDPAKGVYGVGGQLGGSRSTTTTPSPRPAAT